MGEIHPCHWRNYDRVGEGGELAARERGNQQVCLHVSEGEGRAPVDPGTSSLRSQGRSHCLLQSHQWIGSADTSHSQGQVG